MVSYLGLLFLRTLRARLVLVALALGWTVAMGFSRMYLGVHYLSDVLAGFAAGTVWLAACILWDRGRAAQAGSDRRPVAACLRRPVAPGPRCVHLAAALIRSEPGDVKIELRPCSIRHHAASHRQKSS